jgi:predicted anti-sigma-YlaC factor YlaD
MSELKKQIMKVMNKVMLDCDAATMFITKRDYVKLGRIEKLKLAMHLKVCKYCRDYAEQLSIITQQLNKISKVNNENIRNYLSDEQKESIIKEINNQTLKP